MLRNDALKKNQPSLGIIDTKSIKNVDTAEEKGYDGGKKVSGIKLHILVDTSGLPHALLVTTANVTDRDGALEMIALNLDPMYSIEKILVDGGYTGDRSSDAVKVLCETEVEVVRRSEQHKFKVPPKRWLAERSSGWLEKYRRLWKNCERKIHTSLQMTVLAFISVCIRRF